MYYKGSSSGTNSGSAGAAIGGALGGITFCVIVISLVLLALYYVKRSTRRKSYNISSGSRPNKGMAKIIQYPLLQTTCYPCM